MNNPLLHQRCINVFGFMRQQDITRVHKKLQIPHCFCAQVSLRMFPGGTATMVRLLLTMVQILQQPTIMLIPTGINASSCFEWLVSGKIFWMANLIDSLVSNNFPFVKSFASFYHKFVHFVSAESKRLTDCLPFHREWIVLISLKRICRKVKTARCFWHAVVRFWLICPEWIGI